MPPRPTLRSRANPENGSFALYVPSRGNVRAVGTGQEVRRDERCCRVRRDYPCRRIFHNRRRAKFRVVSDDGHVRIRSANRTIGKYELSVELTVRNTNGKRGRTKVFSRRYICTRNIYTKRTHLSSSLLLLLLLLLFTSLANKL